MLKKSNFVYDRMTDRLFIALKRKDEEIAGSVRILNLILDITQEEDVANIEMIDASEYLNSLDMDVTILENLTEATFTFKRVRGGYLITLILKSKKAVVRVPYHVYMPASNQINALLAAPHSV